MERPGAGSATAISSVAGSRPTFFQPDALMPEIPNPAFDRRRPSDAFGRPGCVALSTRPCAPSSTPGVLNPDRALLADVLIGRGEGTGSCQRLQDQPSGGVPPWCAEEASRLELETRYDGGSGRWRATTYEWNAFDNRSVTSTPLARGRPHRERAPCPRGNRRYLSSHPRRCGLPPGARCGRPHPSGHRPPSLSSALGLTAHRRHHPLRAGATE